MTNPEGKDPGSLKIGAVARLSGVSVHTIRKWEERYGAVTPHRTETGKRLYSHADAHRLRLIRRLSDDGLSLREVARHSTEELERALSELTGSKPGAGPSRPVRIAVLGASLGGALARGRPVPAGLDLLASGGTLPELQEQLADRAADLLMMECPTVRREAREQLQVAMAQLGVHRALVVYRFATSADLLALRSPHVAALRAPAGPADLERAVVELMAAAPPGNPAADAAPLPRDIPPHRISEQAMTRLLAAVPRIRCECPHHLVDILLSLRAFEQYSQQCEDASPEDADLHRWLWEQTARARAIFEDAIERVAAAEGISLQA